MSILEIAKLAGVSHTTVARVVNSSGGVCAETAERVRAIMDEIGYIPKPKSLRRGPKRSFLNGFKTGNVAFLTSAEGFHILGYSPLMMNVIRGIEDTLASYGMSMVQGTINANRQLPPIVSRGEVDGVIIWPDLGDVSDETIGVLKNYQCVYLMTGREDRIPGDRVLTNNGKIGVLAAKYLISKGCKNLLQIDLDDIHKTKSAWIERWYGFEAYSREVNAKRLVFNVRLNEILDLKIENKDEAKRSLQSVIQGYGVTGIFCVSDSLAAVIYPLLRKMGIEIGRDVELISCNNERSILAGLDPLPVSIDICPEEIGRRAVEQLRWRVVNPYDTCRHIIEVEPMLNFSHK